jgi:hypothetical protein
MKASRGALLLLSLFGASTATLLPPTANAGGWAVATAAPLPADVTAGTEFAVSFQMRQHGVHLTDLGEIPLAFTHRESERRITAVATAAPQTLIYAVNVTLPLAGTWDWTVGDGFVQPMGSLVAHAATAPLTSADSRSASAQSTSDGSELFLSRGCVVCHAHAAVTETRAATLGQFASFNAGPDLSGFTAAPEYLRMWLANPQAVKPEAQMPDLGLSEADVDTLVRFFAPE